MRSSNGNCRKHDQRKLLLITVIPHTYTHTHTHTHAQLLGQISFLPQWKIYIIKMFVISICEFSSLFSSVSRQAAPLFLAFHAFPCFSTLLGLLCLSTLSDSLVSLHVFNIFANLLGIFRLLLLPLDFDSCSCFFFSSSYVFFLTFFYYYYYYLRDFAQHTGNEYANKRKVQETKQGSWPGRKEARKEGRKEGKWRRHSKCCFYLWFWFWGSRKEDQTTNTHTLIQENCKRQI